MCVRHSRPLSVPLSLFSALTPYPSFIAFLSSPRSSRLFSAGTHNQKLYSDLHPTLLSALALPSLFSSLLPRLSFINVRLFPLLGSSAPLPFSTLLSAGRDPSHCKVISTPFCPSHPTLSSSCAVESTSRPPSPLWQQQIWRTWQGVIGLDDKHAKSRQLYE